MTARTVEQNSAAGLDLVERTRTRALHPAALFALFVPFAALLRWDTFGDPNMHGDEVFYHTVGPAVHHGAIPYVDVWDRKPFGLFTLFYLIGLLSENVIAYQIAVTMFAAGTAFIIAMICHDLDALTERDGGMKAIGQVGALLAGLAYLLWLAPLGGYGRQSPIWYNLLIVGSAWLVVRAIPDLRVGKVPGTLMLAMFLAAPQSPSSRPLSLKRASSGCISLAALSLWHSHEPRYCKGRSMGIYWGSARNLDCAGIRCNRPLGRILASHSASQPQQATALAPALTRAAGITIYISSLLISALIGLMHCSSEARQFMSLWLLAGIVDAKFRATVLPSSFPTLCGTTGSCSLRRLFAGLLGLRRICRQVILAWSYTPW